MVGWLGDMYNKLIPDESSEPGHVTKWRRFVGNLIFVMIATLTVIILCMSSGLPRVGAIAWASDVQSEVQKAIKPVNDRVVKIEEILAASTKVSKSMLARMAADQVMNLVQRRCKSKETDEREYLTSEITRYAEEYEENTAKAYRIPTCDEIGYRER